MSNPVEVRPIRTEEEYRAALAEVAGLMNAVPGSEEEDRLDVLGTLVEAYEARHYPIPPPDPIDLDELFSHLREDDGLDEPMPEGTRMGHVHLHVADVDDALRFYHDLVGFDVMGHVPGMGFVSAGGYHHHLGLNTWAGRGARPAPPGSSGFSSGPRPRARDSTGAGQAWDRAC